MRFSALKFTSALLVALAFAGCSTPTADDTESLPESASFVDTPTPTATDEIIQEIPSNSSGPGDNALNSLSTRSPEATSGDEPETAPAAPAAQSQVWVNTKSGVYHYPGTRYYGKTRKGAYMSEEEAIKNDYRAARNGQ